MRLDRSLRRSISTGEIGISVGETLDLD